MNDDLSDLDAAALLAASSEAVQARRAAEVRDLMHEVRDTVWRRRGVWLEPEVRLVGQW